MDLASQSRTFQKSKLSKFIVSYFKFNITRTNKEAKVHNFYLVEDALRRIKVKFDAKLIYQIMNEERGASLRLLYQIKLAIDKHFA